MTEISEPTAASSLPKKNRPMFFKPTRPPLTKPKESMSFQERLDLIGYEGEVPENYIDPITSCIMDVPCNTNSNTGTKIYDQQTLKNLQTNYAGRDPFNPGSPLAFKDINVSLQEDIARFVSNKEEEYQALKFPKI